MGLVTRGVFVPHSIETNAHLEQQRRIARHLIHALNFETPLLFLDEQILSRSLERIQRHLGNVRMFYAVKANPSTGLIQHYKARGLSFDVASAGEIELLLHCGVKGSSMFLSSPVKDLATIERFYSAGLQGFTFDSRQELDRMRAAQQRFGTQSTPDAFIRIRTFSKDVEVDLSEKFGCSLRDAPALLLYAKECGFNPTGISFHVGTQSYLASNYRSALESVQLLADEMKSSYGLDIKTINIGGGFCDEVVAAKHDIDLDEYYREIGAMTSTLIKHGYALYAEPGRALVASAGTLLTSVTGYTDHQGQRIVHIDDGLEGALSLKLYEHSEFRFIPLEERSDRQIPATIVGPSMVRPDIVGQNVFISESLSIGDVFMVPMMGAYSLSTVTSLREVPCCLVRTEPRIGNPITVVSRPFSFSRAAA